MRQLPVGLLLTSLLSSSLADLVELLSTSGTGSETGLSEFTDVFSGEMEDFRSTSDGSRISLHRSVRSVDGGAGGAPQPLPAAAQPRAYGPGVRLAYESGGQGGGGTSLGKLLGQFLPNTYYSRPKFRYPYYDRNGQGYLLYGYGGKELYEYSVFKPLEGYF